MLCTCDIRQLQTIVTLTFSAYFIALHFIFFNMHHFSYINLVISFAMTMHYNECSKTQKRFHEQPFKGFIQV